MMGLETLFEAAKFLEYKAEVETRGEKGFSALPTNRSSALLLSSASQNKNNHHPGVQNGMQCNPSQSLLPFPYQKRLSNNTSSPRVPAPFDGYKLSDHFYLNQTPRYEFNVGTNRALKGNNSSSGSSKASNGNNSSSGSSKASNGNNSSSGSSKASNGNNSSSSGSTSINKRDSGNQRAVHNQLERKRRAYTKGCFEMLESELPIAGRKNSCLAILRSSFKYIRTLKKMEAEFECEKERLAKKKISLQQRLSTLKKDMLAKGEHLPEEFGIDLERDADITVDYGNGDKQSRKNGSPVEGDQPPKTESENDEESNKSYYQISMPMSKGHHGQDYGFHVVNGLSGFGSIGLMTVTKLSSSPLAGITVEETANSPVGGASFVNCSASSPTAKGFSFSDLDNSTMAVNSGVDLAQYYDEAKNL